MKQVLRVTTFAEERQAETALAYWLSRPAEERIAEVERLRREFWRSLKGNRTMPGMRKSLRVIPGSDFFVSANR
jgi:hypothetical protein